MTLIRRFRVYDLPTATHDNLLRSAREIFAADVSRLDTEHCFYIETTRKLEPEEQHILDWLLAETFLREHRLVAVVSRRKSPAWCPS